jgi:hypothetical protein
MGEFVDQLNFCDLVIMPSLGLLAFFIKIEYLGTSFISKYFNFFKIGAKIYLFKQKLYPNLSIYKTTGI